MNTIELVALAVAVATGVSLAVSNILLRKTYIQDKRLRTLEYITSQFDELKKLGSRALLQQAGDQDILDYLESVPQACRYDAEQKLLQYLYVFNRIGAGIYGKYLSEEVAFEVWTPQYFMRNWGRWETFISQKQSPIGRTHDGFRWLAEVKSPEVSERYPKCSGEARKHRLLSLLRRLRSLVPGKRII